MKKQYATFYNRYFTLVYLTVYKRYPYKSDEVTAEVFEKELFPAVDSIHFKAEKDHTDFILKKVIHYCVIKRFEEIYRTYFNVVHSVSYRYHPHEADDVTSDVFERKILPAIRRNYFVEDKDYTGFIVTITKNWCYSYYRKSSKNDLEDLTDDSVTGELLNPMARIELMIDFSHALEQLTRRQCLVMLLTVGGYTDNEIAKILDATVHSIRQLRYRAREKLKKILG